jgi:hypothetical protein
LEAAGHIRKAEDAAHHIVAFKAEAAAPSRAVLKRFGIDINEAANGIFLHGPEHAKIHTTEYYRTINARLGIAESRAEALEVLSHIRNEIRAGSFPK